MTPPLFLLDNIPDTDEFFLVGDEGHHAARVRRVTPREIVLVSDGVGTLVRCRVERIITDGVHLRILERSIVVPSRPRLVAVQALAKGDRAEHAVEMMTELGVDEIVPWAASRSITQWLGPRGDKALARWRRTAQEASKQSRRPLLPHVAPLARTADVVARIRGDGQLRVLGLVLHEDASVPLATAELADVDEIVVVIGPEGGVAPEELDVFCAAGAVAVRLGESVLRTSTAGTAALSALALRLGRWG